MLVKRVSIAGKMEKKVGDTGGFGQWPPRVYMPDGRPQGHPNGPKDVPSHVNSEGGVMHALFQWSAWGAASTYVHP